MTDINETFERMIAEMQRHGATPAPSKGGSYNNFLRCRETREKILERFLDAFAEGYRLGKEDVEAEPLTLDELRQMDRQPVWGKSLITNKPGEWFIVRVVEMSKTWFIACAGAEQGFGDKDTYGKTWLAYRRPPEEET